MSSKKCEECQKERQLIGCSDCHRKVCAECRIDYDHQGVWVMSVCKNHGHK